MNGRYYLVIFVSSTELGGGKEYELMYSMKLDEAQEDRPDVVVVANGRLTGTPEILKILDEASHIIVCDGALSEYITLTDRVPDAVVGDGDSVRKRDLEALGLSLIKIDDQDSNDLTKAVRYALRNDWRCISILGASGKREDHTLGNMALLAEYYRMGAEVRMISEYGIMFPIEGKVQMWVQLGQQLSFFALSTAPMSVRGVAYPFENRSFAALWEATLNYATDELVEVESEGMVLVYLANEIRK